MAEISSWSLSEIKRDALLANRECSLRGLVHAAKWASELAFSLDQVKVEDVLPNFEMSKDFIAEYDRYAMAKNYFDLGEYDRAAHFLESSRSPEVYFLYMYSRYLSGEKKRLDDSADAHGRLEILDNDHLKILRLELHKKYQAAELDGYCLYLYGVILKKLDLRKEALEMFVDAVHQAPCNWGAWQELSTLCTDRETLSGLSLPEHWVRHFFLAQTSLELQQNEDAFRLYSELQDAGFARSSYVMAQIAVAYHNLREVDMAVELFAQLQKADPHRLDNMDTYSNLLYVKEMRAELAHLAHHCCAIDKYRVETCCVIGNYYSLRSQHEKAVLYFQRALKLNPTYLSAWTLMGHEYVEIKNTSAAIQAYRQAVEINRRDYRAWYGLGQIYEILKMYFYSLYYFRQAQVLRPNDSRMLMALGDCYDKLERRQEAKKCYWKAHSIGDQEGQALVKLAKLYEKLNEADQAAAAYQQFISDTEALGLFTGDELYQAYKYLANYHVLHGRLDDGYRAAQKCMDFPDTREEGKALLKQISRLRAMGADASAPAHAPPGPEGVAPPGDSGGGSIITERSQPHTAPGGATVPTTAAATEYQTPPNAPRLVPRNIMFTP